MDMQRQEPVDFVGGEGLQPRLEALMGRQREGVAVAVYQHGERHTAAINGFTIKDPVQTGCIAKSLTATLIAIAASEGRVHLRDSISSIVAGANGAALPEPFKRICIHHLLTHTSGLDHSLLGRIPRSPDGNIELSELFAALGKTEVIAPPGTLFGYSSVGAWISGGILEHLYDKPYRDVLHEQLFAPLGIDALSSLTAAAVCPSFGGEMRLSAEDLMKLARLYLCQDSKRPDLAEHLRAMHRDYGFDLQELPLGGVRASPGWFDFGNSIGHSGHGDASSAVIRFLPDQDAAITIAAAQPMLAKTAMAMLFKENLAEYRRLGAMKPQPAERWASTDPKPYIGTFENAKYRMHVDIAANGALRARVHIKQDDQGIDDEDPYIKRYFKPTGPDTFIPEQPESKVCPVLLYSHRAADGVYQCLGTNLLSFRRTERMRFGSDMSDAVTTGNSLIDKP